MRNPALKAEHQALDAEKAYTENEALLKNMPDGPVKDAAIQGLPALFKHAEELKHIAAKLLTVSHEEQVLIEIKAMEEVRLSNYSHDPRILPSIL